MHRLFSFFNAGEGSSVSADARGLIQELGAGHRGGGLHRSTSGASAPALGVLLSSCPGHTGDRSSSRAACNPTWGRRRRNLGFRHQEKALSDETPGCANKARVCALTAPADGSPSGDSTGQHSPIHEDMESSLKKHTLPHIAPSHQAMLKLLEIAKGWTYFFLKSKMLIAQVWALLSHPGNQTYPPVHGTTECAGTRLWNFHVQVPHLPGADPRAGTKEPSP